MIFLGFSFVFAAINCGLVDHGLIFEISGDNSTTRITTTTASMPLTINSTQSNTILLLNTFSDYNKPMTIDFSGKNKLSRSDYHFDIQEMWMMI